jgi:hypothetical protein
MQRNNRLGQFGEIKNIPHQVFGKDGATSANEGNFRHILAPFE